LAERKKKATETAAENQESEAVDTHHQKQLPRLRRIEGQVRGLQKMIESERYCLDITHQISAIINALRRVQNDMLHEHLAALGEQIVVEDLSPQARRELANEISEHLKNLS
jgi:CsoR family transcriptional regulator, copper-sensing transcriptional repressor